MRLRHCLFAALLSLSAVACGSVEPPVEETETTETMPLDGAIEGAHDFAMTTGATVVLEASGSWVAPEGDVRTIELPVEGGFVAVDGAGDRVTLDTMSIDLGHLEVGQSLITPEGGWLTGLSLVLQRPVTMDLGDDGTASAEIDLRLEWTLELPDGRRVELGSPEIGDMPLFLEVREREDGTLALGIALSNEGDLLTLDDAVSVSSFALEASAAAM